MEVKLLHYTPLEVADIAISKCYQKKPYEDYEKQKNRINRVANVSKHSSTIEHLEYNFDIDGVSRALLQELARHRLFSFTVKSSRYTLSELKKEEPFLTNNDIERVNKYCYIPNINSYEESDLMIAEGILHNLETLRKAVANGMKNDISKYIMPEAYRTSLVLTGNARVLQNFLALRTDSHALAEIQDLAREMFKVVPEQHKFLFEDYVKQNKGEN